MYRREGRLERERKVWRRRPGKRRKRKYGGEGREGKERKV